MLDALASRQPAMRGADQQIYPHYGTRTTASVWVPQAVVIKEKLIAEKREAVPEKYFGWSKYTVVIYIFLLYFFNKKGFKKLLDVACPTQTPGWICGCHAFTESRSSPH